MFFYICKKKKYFFRNWKELSLYSYCQLPQISKNVYLLKIFSVRHSLSESELSVSDCTKLSETELSRHCAQRRGVLAKRRLPIHVMRGTNAQVSTTRFAG